MELLQLRYFYESAKNENFSQTAKMFMVPTTSVSASIKRLEKELGCSLFDRSANRIRLNAKGQLLQQTLCSVFHDIDRTVEELSDHTQDVRQIKILVRGMRRKITDIITQYSRLHPNISFQTIFDYDDDHYQDYDIVIDDEKESYSGYERVELFSMRLRLKCAADHPLREKKVTLSALSEQPFISMNTNSNMHKILTKACGRVGFTPKIAVLCNDIACYEKFIAAGMGIGIARQEGSDWDVSNRICNLDVTDFNEHYTVYAYYSPKEYYGNVKDFVNFLKRRAK